MTAAAHGATGDAVLAERERVVLGMVLVVTGAVALVLQVAWQRTIALHAGIDQSSVTTVVAAFLGGLGLGNLLGGRLADRLRPTGALVALAGAEAVVAVCALVSTSVLDGGYRALAPLLGSTWRSVGFNAVVLLLPTTAMGLSLPLVARAVTDRAAKAGARVGRLSACSTVGAALGASLAGWHVIGTYGLDGATAAAAAAEGIAVVGLGVLVLGRRRPALASLVRGGAVTVSVVGVAAAVTWYLVARSGALVAWDPWAALAGVGAAGLVGAAGVAAAHRARPSGAEVGVDQAVRAPRDPATADPARRAAWPWLLAYAGTGAAALGFEQVHFRLVDGIMRSNTYTFAHVLSLYLVLFGVGTALGASMVGRVRDARPWFLRAQAAVGLTSVAGLLVLTEVIPATGLGPRLDAWFAGDGFASGFAGTGTDDLVTFGLVLPLVVMGLPVLLMGVSFPLVQSIVTDEVATVGTTTGRIVCANLVGNVVGTVLTGFVLLDAFGVAGTSLVLALPLLAVGVAAARYGRSVRVVVLQAVAAAVLLVAVAVAAPSNQELWAFLNGVEPDDLVLAEDRSCASSLKRLGETGGQLTLNGTSQNGYPFDDFHVLIGLLPALVHEPGADGLAVGYGIGSTSFGMLASERTSRVTSVELCGGNDVIVRRLAEEGVAEMVRLTTDPAHRSVHGDGRAHLAASERRYDIIVPDHSRTTSAGAGNLFSREFFELMRSRLTDSGLASGWLPTYRVENAVTTTFPYSVALTIDSYNASRLYLASRSPFALDPELLVDRFDRISEAFAEPQRSRLRAFLAGVEPSCLTDGEVAPDPRPSAENRDLHPRDEYFIANGGASEADVTRTCGPVR